MASKRPAGVIHTETPKSEVVVVNNGNGIEMIEAANYQEFNEFSNNEVSESLDGEIASTSLQGFSLSQYISDIINPQPSASYPVIQPASKKRRMEYDNLRQLLEEGKLELLPMKKSETFVKWVVDHTSTKLAVYCEVCKSFLSKNSGGSLTEHVRACKAVLNPELLPSISVNPEQTKYFLEKTIDAITKNLIPKGYVINDGFTACIQAAINIGYNTKKTGYGPPNANELVANDKTIEQSLKSLVEKHTVTLFTKLQEILKANGGAFSIDMRTLKEQYICYIVHCIDDAWNFLSYPLDLSHSDNSKVTTPLQKIITRFGLSVNETPLVTDQESKAMKQYSLIPCSATVLENICEYALTPKSLKLDLSADVIKCVLTYSQLLEDLEDVADAIRQTPALNDKLDVSFVYDVKWMPKVIMAKKFLLSSSSDFEMIDNYFKSKKHDIYAKFNKLKNERRSLKEYVDVFKPFPDAVKKLENTAEPTLHLVLPTLETLVKHLETDIKPPNTPKSKLAQSALATLEHFKKVFVKPEHSFALCLDPLNKAELYKIHGATSFQVIKQLFEKEIHKMEAIPIKEEPSEFNPFTSLNLCLPAAVETELNLYYREKVDPKNYNIVTWWKNNANRFPAISHFAKRILSIPASSSLMDQLFGSLNTVNPVERTTMKIETLKELVLYRSIVLANLE